MEGRIFIFYFFLLTQHASGQRFQLCENGTKSTRSCTAQISDDGPSQDDDCKVEYIPPNSYDCADSFSPVTSKSKPLGEVRIQPFIFTLVQPDYSFNHTAPNVVFTNIKWKKMKFRIERSETNKLHCRNITISDNVTVIDQAVLHYDCYWSLTDGDLKTHAHILDIEATDNMSVDRRRFLFYIPPKITTSSTSTEVDWKPFVYVEYLITKLELRVMPPSPRLNITAFAIRVMQGCYEGASADVMVENVTMKSSDQELIYEYSATTVGLYYFVVTPLHGKCTNGEVECQSVKSPKIYLDVQPNDMLYFYVIIVSALIIVPVSAYFIYRRYCAIHSTEIPQPTKIVVIYSSANGLHAKCVDSLVDYLRSKFGLDVLYDGDIPKTSHGDPYFWAEDAIREASVVMYIVGPIANSFDSAMHNDGTIINVFQDVDKLLLNFLKAARSSQQPKEVITVLFDHSNGVIPKEIRYGQKYYLLRDWQKFIAYLSRNMLPKKQIMRTGTGKDLIDVLSRTQKLLYEGQSVES